jgi:acetylornithine/succinyldiaminopimelate/putrescine aminotransferase
MVRSAEARNVYDYGFFSFESKADFLRRSEEFWNPDKTRFWQDAGVDLVIDRREGYLFWDMAGRRLIDLHLNGGTYNLGHRNPELIAVLEQAMGRFDIGNHHFPALARTALAEALVATCPPNLRRVIYGSGGGEATDIAIKTARHTRQRRKIVSIRKGYHGHTGLAVATGDDRFSTLFLSDRPDEFVQVPFNDLDAMDEALRGGDVAGVVIETIPATYGFPLPEPGYLRSVKQLCERHGALYIADEVQTGLMRTGEMWGVTKAGVEPDIMIVGKGITGGMYPIACAVVSEECSAWLKEDGFGHISTGGGAELGCIVALKVLEICGRPEVRSMVHYIAERFRSGLSAIQELYPTGSSASARTAS